MSDDTDAFRATLVRLGLSQGELARMFAKLGDTAAPMTIRRRVEKWAQGRSAVPGEAKAFLTLLERFPAVLHALKEPTKKAGSAEVHSIR